MPESENGIKGEVKEGVTAGTEAEKEAGAGTTTSTSTEKPSESASSDATGTPGWDNNTTLGLQSSFGKPSIWSNGGAPNPAGPGAAAATQVPGGGENRFAGVLAERPLGPQGNAAPYMAKPPSASDQPTTDQEISDLAAIWSRVQASQNPFSAGGSSSDNLFHRRSSTGPYKAPWEARPPVGPAGTGGHPAFVQGGGQAQNFLQTKERFQPQRRFSLSPNLHGAAGQDGFDNIGMMRRGGQFPGRSMADSGQPPMPIRRHSVAGPLAGPIYHAPGRFLSEAFNTLHLDDSASGAAPPASNGGMPMGYSSLLEDFEELLDEGSRRPSISSSSEVGKGIALHSLPHDTNLYIVEFKAGRSDIFYVAEDEDVKVKKGDLVIVEADRGRDLGKVINESITPYQIHMLQAQHSEALNDLHRVNREIHPKRIYRLAEPSEVAMLVTKSQDEAKGLSVCQTKVRQKKLAMEVVDAEYQWDRRKLTFYFVADRRIDFRELVRDLFKIYKTRIWMCAVNPVMQMPGQGPMIQMVNPVNPAVTAVVQGLQGMQMQGQQQAQPPVAQAMMKKEKQF